MNQNNKRKWMLPLCLLLAAVFVIAPAAWFAGLWTSGSAKIPFTSGGNPTLYQMNVWMYQSVFEKPDETPTWVDVTLDDYKHTDNSGYIIPELIQNTGDGEQFVLSSLHFGKIDNLNSLNPDNRIYFCFQLKKSEHGSSNITFNFDYADYGTGTTHPDDPRNSITIYNLDKVQIDHFEGNGLQYDADNRALMELLEFSYCVTSVAPETAVALTEDNPFPGLTFTAPTAITNPVTDQPIENLVEDQDEYYLYVCMSPKLENFGLHEHILEFFAQSYMLFDVTFSFEVHD